MFRALATIVPRVAARAAPRSAPAVAAVRRTIHAAAATRAPAPKKGAAPVPAPVEAEIEGEEEEAERELVPFPEAQSRLVAGLTKEVDSFDLSEDFAESYAKDRALTVQIDLATETVVATRDAEGHKVQISFRAEALDTQQENENEETQENENEEENKLPEHRFHVDITSPNGKIMRLECFNSDKGELEVGNITFPTTVSANPATAPRLTEAEEAESARSGLRVEELSEEGSQSLFDYLEALGVDDDLAVFVSSQAQHVRTQAMINRLNSLKAFAQ